ncbi:hypothetical protein [Maricaulis sp.]|uniref:hypothetical protein n=1 Tax=Maricaulis sp. TaxID=1486257 RepID=UPI00261DF9D7|nr:hypothetical protein [Maricaulis sp.]
MQLRFAAAGVLCALAALAGLLLPPATPSAGSSGQASSLTALAGPDGADVQAFVERLGRTNLFPAARTVAEIRGETDPEAGTGVAQPGAGSEADAAARSPAIRALVRREAEWRLYAAGEASLTDVFVPGEELFDGWVIAEISPRTLRLERNGDYQIIDVFVSNDVGQ